MTEHEEMEELEIPEGDDEEEDDEEMGLVDKIINVFLDPHALFKKMADKPEWLMPVIVVIVLQLALTYAAIGPTRDVKLEAQRFGWNAQATARNLQGDEKIDFLTEAEKKWVETSDFSKFLKDGISLIIMVPIVVFLMAGILYLISLIQGLDTSYARVLSVVSYTSLIGFLGNLIDGALKILGVVRPERLMDWALPVTGLGYYLPQDTHMAIKMVCTRIDPFKIWVFVAMVIGLQYVNRCSKKAAIITVVIMIVITLMYLAGMGFLQQMGLDQLEKASGNVRVEVS